MTARPTRPPASSAAPARRGPGCGSSATRELRPERGRAHAACSPPAAPVVATLDGDGQNDPAFIPQLVAALEAGGRGAALAAGQRVGRKDGALQGAGSRASPTAFAGGS